MIYKAEVTTATEKRHYYGQTFKTFKERFYGHQSDLRTQGKAESTTLSKFVWQERSKGEELEIKWSKLSSAKPYTLGGRSCPLCLAEKTAIAKDNTGEMLNRRRELMNRCLHKDPYKLSNFCTSLTTGHQSPAQPNDVLLDAPVHANDAQPHDVPLDDPVHANDAQPHDALLDAPVHANDAQSPSVQSVPQIDRVQVGDAQSDLVLHDPGHVDDVQTAPVQPPNILTAQVQSVDNQSACRCRWDEPDVP